MGHEKERFIRSNGSGSYELLGWCKDKNEGEICIFRKIRGKVGEHHGSVLSPLLFAIVMGVITENARRGVVNELLCADDLVLMSETVKLLREKFWNWKDALESTIRV